MVHNFPELNWPTALLGPMPRTREIRVVCLVSLVCAGLILLFGLFPARQGGNRLGYEEDFVAFYGIGRLLNEHPPERLYDFPTQETIYLELRPEARFLGLPYIHAPFEALIFQPLARLPFRAAYLAWLAISLTAYSVAMLAMIWRFGPHDPVQRRTALLLTVAFAPFMMESWLGGNVAVIACLGLGLAIALADAGRPLLGGAALALCVNKPSLLLLVLPMLLVSRQVTMLAGFTVGVASLVAASSLALGPQAWPDFLDAMLRWARMTSAQEGIFRDWKYVDLNAFSRVLPGGRSWVVMAMTLAATGAVVFALLRLWWTLPRAGRDARALVWAATITWTLVLNAYVPIYDCALLSLVGLLAASALRDPVTGDLPPAFATAVLVCFVAAWVTQPIAQLLRLQIYTLVLGYSGLYLLRRCQAAQASDLARATITQVHGVPQGAASR
jgi:hypothetical protein